MECSGFLEIDCFILYLLHLFNRTISKLFIGSSNPVVLQVDYQGVSLQDTYINIQELRPLILAHAHQQGV